jgi:hypothetical protein
MTGWRGTTAAAPIGVALAVPRVPFRSIMAFAAGPGLLRYSSAPRKIREKKLGFIDVAMPADLLRH